jgi:drug/metabolite transporter (DMT)-like permease
MAEAVALNFLSAIFLGIGAIIFLGEASFPARWWAAAVSFIGMLVIIRPGVEAVSPGSLSVVASALLWSTSLLIMKVLLRTDSSLGLVAYLYVFGMLLLLPLTLVTWQWPSLEEILWLALMGVTSSLGSLAVAQAFKEADTTAIVPVDFTRLVWASIIGYVFFHEVPGVWTLVGGLIIFGSTTYLTLTERARR